MRENISEGISELMTYGGMSHLAMRDLKVFIIPEAAMTDFDTLIAWITTVARLQK